MHQAIVFTFKIAIVINNSIKKKILPSCISKNIVTRNRAPLEAIQLLSETFFNIVKNERNIPDAKVRWATLCVRKFSLSRRKKIR